MGTVKLSKAAANATAAKLKNGFAWVKWPSEKPEPEQV
jgi:hypothetical protein